MIWPKRNTPPPLNNLAIHVWNIPLTLPQSALSAASQVLTPDEWERARRFRFEPDRKRFIAARGQLRILLGTYLAIPPDQLKFGYGPHGKPFLETKSTASMPLNFNLSHSHEQALLAITRLNKVGVDIERIRESIDDEHIAQRFFSKQEAKAFSDIPPDLKKRTFFEIWTRKEAFLKANGIGLFQNLDQFDVSVDPFKPFKLLKIEGSTQKAAQWSTWTLNPHRDFAAALVVEGAATRLDCWTWSSD